MEFLLVQICTYYHMFYIYDCEISVEMIVFVPSLYAAIIPHLFTNMNTIFIRYIKQSFFTKSDIP